MILDGPALLRAIVERPADDGPRLVYADFLQQHGDAQGELIAVQCRLANLASDAPDHGTLAARARALIDAYGVEWAERLGAGVRHVQYQRGLATAAQVPVRAGVLELLDRAPIRDLGFVNEDGCDDPEDDNDTALLARLTIAHEIATDPRLANLELLATGVRWGEAAFRALFASPHLGHVRGLQIADADCHAYAGEALATAQLPALEVLALCGDWIGLCGDAGIAALARAQLPALRDLAILNVGCGEASARSLAASTTLTALTGLDFGWGSYNPNRIGPHGATAIAESTNFRALRRLALDFNAIGDTGLAALASSPHLDAVRSLSLKDNQLTDTGLRALAAGTGMPHLEVLELTFNRGITHAGITALAASPRMATLTSLWLRQIPLGPAAALAIARSPHARALKSLNLLECKLDDASALAIVESANLDGLTEVQLSGNKLSADTRATLRARFGDRVTVER